MSIKIVAMFKFKEGMAREDAVKHWEETHAAIVRENMPLAEKYVQNHAFRFSVRPPEEPDWDGVSEIWFENMDAVKATFARPEAALVLEDEKKFTEKVFWLMANERFIF